MRYQTTPYILLCGLILSMTVWANETNEFALISPCIACHGPNGSSLGLAMPTIAGLNTDTFIDIMEQYQNDERPSTIMGRLAKAYNTTDFEVMAHYFSQQSFVPAIQEVDAQKAKKGQKLHEKYCEKCHERNGTIDQEGTGIIAGQWMTYLQFNLSDFQTGVRSMPKNKKKRFQKMLQQYGEESLEHLLHFYGSQQSRNPIHAHP